MGECARRSGSRKPRACAELGHRADQRYRRTHSWRALSDRTDGFESSGSSRKVFCRNVLRDGNRLRRLVCVGDSTRAHPGGMTQSQVHDFLRAFTPKLIIVWREGQLGRSWRRDALAGLTVAIVALPLAMALGIASGASPNQGLVTAVVAGFLISLLGGSRVQIGGPTGAFVVIVAGVIAAHGYAGLVVATLLAGLILFSAGVAGGGAVSCLSPLPPRPPVSPRPAPPCSPAPNV